MKYYVHYLHFSDYCPHLCRHGEGSGELSEGKLTGDN